MNDAFDEWLSTVVDCEGAGLPTFREAYAAGMRHAAELAKQYPGVYGNSPTAKVIEREAKKISEG